MLEELDAALKQDFKIKSIISIIIGIIVIISSIPSYIIAIRILKLSSSGFLISFLRGFIFSIFLFFLISKFVPTKITQKNYNLWKEKYNK